jgi:uncharacterized protein
MISRKLLDIVVCPVSRQPLAIADAGLIGRLNQAISAGQVKDNAGRLVASPVQEGLIRQDGRVLYPVRDDIPVLLADEGIPLDAVGL